LSLFIGIDLGTSGCRAIAINNAGDVCGQAASPIAPATKKGDSSEQLPSIWWQATLSTLKQLLHSIQADTVTAIAVDGTSSTLLLTDSGGHPVTPALMYNDNSSRAEAEIINTIAPPSSPTSNPGSSLAKLLKLTKDTPTATHALHQADWITGMLMGNFGTSDENNCLKMGYDPVARQWPKWLEALAIPSTLLPKVVAPGTTIGLISAEIAQMLGLPTNVNIVSGTTDSTAAFLATGASEPGEAVTSLGSTLVLKIITEQPVTAPEHGVYSHRMGDLWLAGGASNSGGSALLKHFSLDEIKEMTPLLDPSRVTGFNYYPLPDTGERFPVNDPDLKPVMTPRPSDKLTFFQAMLEGIAEIEKNGYQLLKKLGAPYPTSIRTVGGGATNPGWTAIRGNKLGVPMIEPVHSEAAYGSALLARRGTT
jgi:sugar (pentulose or hexulose) kinase